jgi:hypothetical protein
MTLIFKTASIKLTGLSRLADCQVVKIWWPLSSDYSADPAHNLTFLFCRNGSSKSTFSGACRGRLRTGGKHDHREKSCDSRATRRWHFAVNGAKRSTDRRIPAYRRRRWRQSRYIRAARTWLLSGSAWTDISIHSTEPLSPVGSPAGHRSAHSGST